MANKTSNPSSSSCWLWQWRCRKREVCVVPQSQTFSVRSYSLFSVSWLNKCFCVGGRRISSIPQGLWMDPLSSHLGLETLTRNLCNGLSSVIQGDWGRNRITIQITQPNFVLYPQQGPNSPKASKWEDSWALSVFLSSCGYSLNSSA